MDELFYKLEKQAVDLSDLEKVVFKFLKSSPETFANETIHQISEIIYVSTATISRTVKKLGFQNFQELKFTIQQYSQTNTKQNNKSLDATNYQTYVIDQIVEAMALLDDIKLETILQTIKEASNIEIYSVGSSLPIGIDLSRKLLSLGKPANALIDWDDLNRKSKIQTDSELAILISLSGETKHIIDFATNLKDSGVPMLGIVGIKESRLEELVDYCIYAPSRMKYHKDADISSRVAIITVLEYLIIKYSEMLEY